MPMSAKVNSSMYSKSEMVGYAPRPRPWKTPTSPATGRRFTCIPTGYDLSTGLSPTGDKLPACNSTHVGPPLAYLSRCALLCINGPLYNIDHKVGGIVRCQRHFGHGFSSRVQCMSPRRRLRANRERWRAEQVMRDYRRRTAADLAGVLALFGHCAVPGNAWTAAEVAHRFARDGAEAASAAEPAMRCARVGPSARIDSR